MNKQQRKKQVLEATLQRLDELCQKQYRMVAFYYERIERTQASLANCEAVYLKTVEAINRVK